MAVAPITSTFCRAKPVRIGKGQVVKSIIVEINRLLDAMAPKKPAHIVLHVDDFHQYQREAIRQMELGNHETDIKLEAFKGIPVEPLNGAVYVG